ncbi:ubiquinone biosynthesis monooxygenase Coq7 [Entomophthora muscae]|uniref:Ubiquinone biosynthesis monooxygenase Coq7 n=1 Tax=Entomophthora muscae TaxID=34485 RepID=A0ACC2UGC3_9FUNG|nr:ubiquinone biosynthesis monooxygenase Coq7 [Entomophthora muscae]
MGQHLVFKSNKKLEPLIKHMWEQEKVHLEKFDDLVSKYNVRPTALTPIWKLAGLTLGISTALLGKEAAMACTEAVETVIGEHYNDQLRDLAKTNTTEFLELRKTIKAFRDDELEHLETAIEHDSHKAPLYNGLNFVIQAGCKTAIWVAQRI